MWRSASCPLRAGFVFQDRSYISHVKYTSCSHSRQESYLHDTATLDKLQTHKHKQHGNNRATATRFLRQMRWLGLKSRPLDTFYVTLKTIFPAIALTDAKHPAFSANQLVDTE